jgi:hypothetical protein
MACGSISASARQNPTTPGTPGNPGNLGKLTPPLSSVYGRPAESPGAPETRGAHGFTARRALLRAPTLLRLLEGAGIKSALETGPGS